MAYTPLEEVLLEKAKCVIPEAFIANSSDEKILCFADLVINDMNWFPPTTNYTRTNYPQNWVGIIVLGMAYFSQVFKQMEVTLQDFNYNDNGLTVNVDQTAKLNTALVNILKAYGQQVEYMKKSLLMTYGTGLGTPRFQSQIGQFLKISLGSSFSWGSTPSGR